MILQARDLKKVYGQGEMALEILKGVSLDIEGPQTVSVMGRSGCGKSTLISLLAGLDLASSGEISVLDRPLKSMSARELNVFRARNIGIIFQQFHLLDHLTALENVRLPLDLNGIRGADALARGMLETVGLGHRLEHVPEQLSRGECQRVAIARVLVMKPALVLADEPTGSLDVKTGQEVMELIFRLAATEKIALVMVTHDPAVAARCERHFFMEAGQLSTIKPSSLQ
ncbi:MAG: ABC transporter ATP-binding protein [Bdellovibrionaceae bacterium]|nr:ABC transporter ATP-binding protein [Pseudobdellovibrionaceae bacterium]